MRRADLFQKTLMLGKIEGGIEVKPSPQGVLDILEFFNCDTQNVFFIGDSDVDIKTAKNANITSIGVTWGYRTIKHLEGADYIANSPLELLDILLKR